MKQLLSFVGKMLLLLAFMTTAAEVAAHARNLDLSWIPATAEIWSVYAPKRAAAFAAAHPDGLFHLLLLLPPWALFGIPGFALVMRFHDKHVGIDPELEESMLLYDELTKRVKNGEYDDVSDEDTAIDDSAPSHHEDMILADESYAQPVIQVGDGPKRDYLFGDKNQT